MTTKALIPPCGVLDLNFQKRLNPLRCQWTTVSGFTMTRDLRQGVQIRESTTQKSRSTIRILGRLFVLFITANCWRSTRFSAARFEVILNFDQMNKTKFPSVFIMSPAWQAHANLSMISESTNNCEGQGFFEPSIHFMSFEQGCLGYRFSIESSTLSVLS